MGNSNKGFNSVVPLPVTEKTSPVAKRTKSTNKTSISPGKFLSGTTDLSNVNNDQSLFAELEPGELPANEANEAHQPTLSDPFDFKQTESQLRRKGMADCEFECSQITNYLYVGGYHVAGNLDILKANGITRIVNCASAVVENHFIHEPGMTYLSINMVDGRQDDIFWFLCDIIQFILRGRTLGEKILIHCEKGVSRSCSFAIAYRMWSAGEKWKSAFEYVKARRAVCAPNTAFTCNLIEIGEILAGEAVTRNMVFRTAFHLPHDPLTAVLKLCRNAESRKIIVPSTSVLDPRGVFVIRTTDRDTNNQHLFVWKGALASSSTLDRACALAKDLYGIVTNTQDIQVETQGAESVLFANCVTNDGPYSAAAQSSSASTKTAADPASSSFYEDLYDNKPSLEAALVFQREHEQLRISRDRPPPPLGSSVRESSIKGFDVTYPQIGAADYRREASNRSIDTSGGSGNSSSSVAPTLGKTSRVPSSKLNIAVTAAEGTAASSRRGSHSKFSLDAVGTGVVGVGAADLQRGNSRIALDLSKALVANGEQGSSASPLAVAAADRRPEVTFAADTTPTASPVQRQDQSGEFSKLGSASGGSVVMPHLSLPALGREASLKMPQLTEGGDETNSLSSSRQTTDRQMSDRREVWDLHQQQQQQQSLQLSSSRRSLIDKINEAVGGAAVSGVSPRESSPVVPLDARRSSRPSVISGLALPVSGLGRGADPAHAVDGSSARSCRSDGDDVVDIRRSEAVASAAQKTVLGAMMSASVTASPVKAATATASSASSIDAPLGKSSSKSRLLLVPSLSPAIAAAGSGLAVTDPNSIPPARRDSGAGMGLFRQASKKKIVPLQFDDSIESGVAVGERKLSDATNSTTTATTGALSRLASPSSGESKMPDESQQLGTGTDSRPLVSQQLLSTPLKLGQPRSATSLSLHDAVPQRTPSVDRHPDHVGLVRGPTPAEDLLVLSPHHSSAKLAVSSGRGSPRESDDALKANGSRSASLLLIKPTLFQVVARENRSVSRSSRREGLRVLEWQAMGVYDDEDLQENCLLLLLCPKLPHYLWLGGDFNFERTGLSDPEDDAAVLQWIGSVMPGENHFEGASGSALLKPGVTVLNRSGEESEAFWTAFNEGF